MSWLFTVCAALLKLYRERDGAPGFWAEPLNAVSNLAFLVAALLGLLFARRHGVADKRAWGLIALAAVVGFGSFVFHTVPNRITMWLDILPIAAFQVSFLWLLSRRMLTFSSATAAGTVACVMGVSFALLPIKEPLNGSLFYLPSLLAMGWLGMKWAERAMREPYLLVAGVGCFGLALAARTLDWHVPWEFGSHFIWHLLNGVVVYLGLRAWMIHCLTQTASATMASNVGMERSQQPHTPDTTDARCQSPHNA